MSRALSICLVGAASVALLSATPALAAPGNAAAGLEDLKELNLIVLGNKSGGKDVEGKTYVGGNVTGGGDYGNGNNSGRGFKASSHPTLTVGGSATGNININDGANFGVANGVNPPGAYIGGNAGTVSLNPTGSTLLVGGSIDNTNGVTGGTILAGGSLGSNSHPTGTTVAGNQGAGFSPTLNGLAAQTATMTSDLTALSTLLGGLAPTASTSSVSSGAMTINAVDGGHGFAVFDITNGQTFFNLITDKLSINLPTVGGKLDTLIINVSGSTAYDLGNFNFNDSDAISNVIWNFEGASTISFGRGFEGSVLALGANVSNGNAMEGSVVAQNFAQNGEVHLGTYNGTDSFLPKTPGVPEPATWAMMLMGFFGLGGLVRRQRRLAAA